MLVGVLLLAAAGGVPGTLLPAQQDLTGRAILSYQLFGTDELDSRGFHQTYDLRYQRDVSEPLRFRLSFRGEGNDGRSELGLFTTNTTYWQLQPSGEVDYFLPKLQVRGTYDLYDTRSSFNDLADRRKLQRITEKLFWYPDDYPAFTLTGEQRTQKDPLASIDQTDNFAVESLSLTRPTFTLGQTAYYQTLDLNTVGFSRRNLNVQGNGQYQDSLLQGRLSVSAIVNGGFARIDDESKGQAALVPTQVMISTALVSHDETPLDSRDVPPASTPALIDGDFNRSAAISIGPDGLSFANIALDFQRFVAVDQFRIFVRDSAGNFVKIGGLVQWDVYTSGNGLDWTAVSGRAAASYVISLSAYDVTFPKTTARFFKLVSFGTNSVETLVTEVQAYFHTSFAAGETTRTDLRFVTGNLNLSGHLTDWLTLSYYGLLNDYKTSPQGKAEYGSLDHDQIVTLEGRPSDHVDATLRYEDRRANTGGGFSDNLSGYWAILQYTFNPRLSTTLEASRINETNLQDITTDTLRLHQYARVYGSLDVYFDGGVAKQDNRTLDLRSLQTFLTAYSYAYLTRNLRLILSANLQRTKYEGAGAISQIPSLETKDGRAYVELYYRPSSQLLLSGRFGYVWGTVISGTTKTYRVEWYPFAGGTVGIGTIYDDDIETNGFAHRFRRIQLLPHWQINPHAILDLNYNWLTLKNTFGGTTTATSARQFYATLTLTL